MRGLLTVVVCAVALNLGCGSSSDEDGVGGAKKPQPQLVGAEGVGIWQVALYQGSKRVLAQDNVAQPSSVPIVAGRDALIRVFYGTSPGGGGKEVVGRLQLAGQEPIEVTTMTVDGSAEHDLATTINFEVPGHLIGDVLDYRVSILEEGSTDNAIAHYPMEGTEVHPVDGPGNTLRVMFVPFAYNADGSGRVPDLGPEGLEVYRQRLLQLYPVSNVEVQVREPVQWSGAIQPNGQGWQEVGFELYNIRNNEKPGPDWYYYGIFDPSASFMSFCGGGCLLGVTLLNNQPADVGEEALRMALGVGFPQYGPGTTAHELGHAHGREHINCGGPDGIDPNYPWPHDTIGVWGWDIVFKGLVDPAVFSDIMGYCDDQWISDYQFTALLNRGRNVNAPRYHTPTAVSSLPALRYETVMVDGIGNGRWRPASSSTRLSSPPNVTITLARQDGTTREAEAHFFRYDHLPGGWLMFPEQDSEVTSIRAIVDGTKLEVLRTQL